MTYFGLSEETVSEYEGRIHALRNKPLISFVLPLYHTPVELLQACLHSVLEQKYNHIELIVIDDSKDYEACKGIVSSIIGEDHRVKYFARSKNGGISAATNDGLRQCSGEVVAFIDHDDELTPDAALTVAEYVVNGDDFDVWYSDQNKCDVYGNVIDHFLKPDWSPIYSIGVMYIGHILVVRRNIACELGFDEEFDGVQDYEFMLRLSRQTQKICHIDKVLYKWRSVSGSLADRPDSKPFIGELQQKAAQEHVQKLGRSWNIAQIPGATHRMAITAGVNSHLPSVSIIIPTRNQGELIAKCLSSIEKITQYPNYEVIIVDNKTTDLFARLAISNAKAKHIIYDKHFNFSDACNFGSKYSSNDILLFMNNDTEVINSDWLSNMTIFFEDQKVGAVGATLLYPDRSIQHAGVVVGARGTADHVMRGFNANWDGYAGSLQCAREVSCATAACLAIRRSLFESLRGFDVDFNNHYQDVDLCLRVISSGYRIINSAASKVVHHESVSRKDDGYDYGDRALLIDLWYEFINNGDPFYNRGLSLEHLDYSIKK